MKKALVVAMVMVLGLGALAFGQLTGEWETTIGIDPGAATLANFLPTLDSTLTVDYALGGWTFGAVSDFDLTGFSAQEFTAGGVLGAFTFSSTMTFSPQAVVTNTYPVLTQTPTCSTWIPVATTAPKFLKFTAEGSVSIAGINFSGLFLIDQSHWMTTDENYAFTIDFATQTDSVNLASSNNGVGWKFTIAGSAGGIDITSYTYFNLNEYDASTKYCPAVGKRGLYTIPVDGCGVSFTEEYLMFENFSFGCMSIDAALKLTCTGFDSFKIVVSDISLMGFASMDIGINFTTTSKALDLCLNLDSLVFDCVSLEVGFGNSGYVTGAGPLAISNITVHGFSFTGTFGSVTFTSMTELDKYSALMSGATTWSYINGSATTEFLVPWAGISSYTAADDGTCIPPVGVVAEAATYVNVADGYFESICLPTYRYKLWEMFEITSEADACCGGAFSFDVSTYFGDKQQLAWAAWGYVEAGGTAVQATYLVGDAGWELLDASTTTTCFDTVTFDYGYADVTTATQLFGWAETDAEVSIGVGSNVTLTLGFDISAFGWEALEFGFDFTF